MLAAYVQSGKLGATPMDNPARRPAGKLFELGNHRGMQAPGLTAMQILFMREHNRQAERIKVCHRLSYATAFTFGFLRISLRHSSPIDGATGTQRRAAVSVCASLGHCRAAVHSHQRVLWGLSWMSIQAMTPRLTPRSCPSLPQQPCALATLRCPQACYF